MLLMLIVLGLNACHHAAADYPTVSFKNDVQPIFTANCALSGCHIAPNAQANLVLDSANAYTRLSHSSYVNAGNPETSVLYLNMIGSSSDPMPPTGILGKEETDKVYYWIKQGAANN